VFPRYCTGAGRPGPALPRTDRAAVDDGQGHIHGFVTQLHCILIIFPVFSFFKFYKVANKRVTLNQSNSGMFDSLNREFWI
jgi:hypothetical protein